MKLTLGPIAVGLASADAVISPSATLAATPESFFVPRSFGDRPLARRDGACRDDSHSCLDVLRGDKCCQNTDYCYIDRAGDPRCCPIGSNCVDNSPCKSDRFFCTTDITVGGSVQSGTTGCCARSCPQTSFYLCPTSLGGNCCPYGAQCRPDGNCVETKTGAETTGTGTGAPPGLTPASTGAEGCAPTQVRCPGGTGTGCCGAGQRCTQLGGTAYCAVAGTPVSTIDAEPAGDSLSDSHLSAGAKAGIGIGAAAAGSLVVGAGAWLCVARRRRASRSSRRSGAVSETTVPQPPGPRRGLTDDCQEPSPASGPLSETGNGTDDDTAHGPERAVPTRPERPGDIAAPVEMDSSAAGRRRETIEGRFELYGSEVQGSSPPPPPPPNSADTPRSEEAEK